MEPVGNEAATVAADASAGLGEFASSTGAEQTTDEILGIGTETGPETSDAAETETTTAEATEGADETATEGAEAELPIESAPEWLKPLFGHQDPKIAAQAKSVWNRIQAYSQLGTVAEARALKQAVDEAGGLDTIRELQQKSLEIDQVDEAYYSADPEKQADVAAKLFQDDPQAFASMFQTSADVLKQADPEKFNGFVSEAIVERFTSAGPKFEEHMAAMVNAARKGDTEALTDLAARYAAWWEQNAQKLGFGERKAKQELDPSQLAAQREREKLSTEKQQYYQERYQGFTQTVNSSVRSQVEASIKGTVEKALEGVKVGEGAKKRLIAEISQQVEAAVSGDVAHRSKLNRLVNPSGRDSDFSQYRTDTQTQTQVVSLIASRARQAIPGIAKKVIAEWTNDVIGTNRSVAAKARAAAARPDISGGVPKNYVGKEPLTVEKAKNMSTDDILNYDGPVSTRL